MTSAEVVEKIGQTNLGIFLVFVTPDDAHSPVMMNVYDQVVEYTDRIIPMFLIDALQEPEFRERCLVYSVPTFVWLDAPPPQGPSRGMPINGRDSAEILLKLSGTVMFQKIRREIDAILERVL